jgi:hypothetical protein
VLRFICFSRFSPAILQIAIAAAKPDGAAGRELSPADQATQKVNATVRRAFLRLLLRIRRTVRFHAVWVALSPTPLITWPRTKLRACLALSEVLSAFTARQRQKHLQRLSSQPAALFASAANLRTFDGHKKAPTSGALFLLFPEF